MPSPRRREGLGYRRSDLVAHRAGHLVAPPAHRRPDDGAHARGVGAPRDQRVQRPVHDAGQDPLAPRVRHPDHPRLRVRQQHGHAVGDEDAEAQPAFRGDERVALPRRRTADGRAAHVARSSGPSSSTVVAVHLRGERHRRAEPFGGQGHG